MADLEIAYKPAAELAAQVRKKEISPVEIMENCLARINEVNPALNCFCFVFADEAMAQARKAEAAVMRGEDLGLLHGIPVAIKDFTPTKGKRTTRGSRAFENWIPDHNALIVDRLCGAGASWSARPPRPNSPIPVSPRARCGELHAILGTSP